MVISILWPIRTCMPIGPKKMKKIFVDNGFHIVYDYDVNQKVGDGFFFTLGYGKMSGGELLKELLYYGVSSISLGTTGSDQSGIRLALPE